MYSWLASKVLPAKKKSSNVTRVQNMVLQPGKCTEKFFSPTLFQIKEQKIVKKMSSIYEENIAAAPSNDTPLTSRKLMVPMVVQDDGNRLLALFESLLNRDKQYTENMKKMHAYVNELEFEARFMPEDDRKQLILSVFGNIKGIFSLHTEKFQPFIETFIKDLRSSNIKISTLICDFARKFIILCNNGTFNPYLVHAIIEKDSTVKRNTFYSHLMVYGSQKFQYTFSFDPIAQLTHYGLIFEEILKEAQKKNATDSCIYRLTEASKTFNKIIANVKSAAKK